MRTLRALALSAIVAALAAGTAIAAPPSMKLCTGGQGGNYFPAGKDIAAQATNLVNVEVVSTAGSMDNFARMAAGECDAAIVQSDAWLEFKAVNPGAALSIEEVTPLYAEVYHLVCHVDAKIDSVADLNARTTLMRGPNGSGTQVTWANLVRANAERKGAGASWKSIPTLPVGGISALGKIRSGQEAQCLMFVAGVGSADMKRVDRSAKDDKNRVVLKLVSLDDGRTIGASATWTYAKGDKGIPLYRAATIQRGTYQNLNGGNDVPTFSLSAMLVVTDAWKSKNAGAMDSITQAALDAVPVIAKRMAAASQAASR